MKIKLLLLSNFCFIVLFLFAFKNVQESNELNSCNTGITIELMNKFYVGIENPIRITALTTLPIEAIRTINCTIKVNKNCNEFLVTTTEVGKSQIIVHKYGKVLTGAENENELLKFEFKNIMLPDPVLFLKEKFKNSLIGSGEMRAQRGLEAHLPGFDTKVEIESFKVTFVKRRAENPITYINEGSRFIDDVSMLIQSCKPGDQLFFEDIKVKCPSDKIARELEGFSLRVK